MLTRPALGATVLAAVLLTAAGCGSTAGTPEAGASPASPSPSPSPTSQGSGPAAPAPAPTATITPGGPMVSPSAGGSCAGHPVPGSGATITLHNSSNGGTFCISIGQRVLVELSGKPGRMWSPIRSDSTVLARVSYGQLMLRAGETAAAFAAHRRGIARLSSARPVCASGPVHCDALMAFQVTIMVGGMQGSPVH